MTGAGWYGAYERSAEIYDVLYSPMVDYRANAERIRQLVAERNPAAATLLEVACGTGAYLEPLAAHYDVTGLDLSPAMLARARSRLPNVELIEGDMSDFDLAATFDVVVCLFSSIAYIQTRAALRSTIACFARHLAPGGVAILEPWYPPDRWQEGYVATLSARTDEIAVSRASTSRREGQLVTMTFAFAVAHSNGEVETFVEEHITGQFTVEEHLEAFAATGLSAEYDPDGLIGRGLYVAAHAQ